VEWPDPSQPGMGQRNGSDSVPSFGLLLGLLALGQPERLLWEE